MSVKQLQKRGVGMSFGQIMGLLVLSVSAVLLAVGAWNFYRWRPSVFDTTTGYIRNVRRIPDGTEADIRVDAPQGEIHCKCGKHHKPMIYYEVVYHVQGIEYFLWTFSEEDDTAEHLPVKWIVHYHRFKPHLAYREGVMREGLVIGWIASILGVFFFALSLFSLLT